MKIQPITTYRANNFYANKNVRKADEPVNQPENQPNFKGIKGLFKGIAVGAGVTAGGVALIAGVTAIPVFLTYIAANSVIAGATGHMIENRNKTDKA